MWQLEKDPVKLLNLVRERVEILCGQMERFYQTAQRGELFYQGQTCSRDFLRNITGDNLEENQGVYFAKPDTFDYNVIRQNCVAAKNQITSSKPRVVFTTDDQDYQTIQISEKLGKHIASLFEDQDIYTKASKAFLNACIMKIGILKLNSYNNISCLHPQYFFCPQPYRGSSVPKEGGNFDIVSPYVLLNYFPKKKDEIMDQYIKDKEKVEDVTVFDLYHAGNRRVVFTKDLILKDTTWPRDFIPYEFFRWEATTEGVLQKSIPDEIGEAQNQIRIHMRIIQESYETIGIPKVFVRAGTRMADSALLDGMPGDIIEYEGEKPPDYATPSPLSTDYFLLIDKLVMGAAQLCGNNPMNMSGELPKELNQASGIALQNYSDLDSKKFSDIRAHYEKTFLSLARKILLMGGVKSIDYDKDLKKIVIEEELSKMRLAPASMLPETPAGQMQIIQAMITSGLVEREEGLAMLKHPDVKKLISSRTDRIRQIDLLLEEAMRDDKMPVLYKELGIDIYLDRARKIFATIQRQRGEDYKPLTKLSIFIDDLLYEMQGDQNQVVQSLMSQNNPQAFVQ